MSCPLKITVIACSNQPKGCGASIWIVWDVYLASTQQLDHLYYAPAWIGGCANPSGRVCLTAGPHEWNTHFSKSRNLNQTVSLSGCAHPIGQPTRITVVVVVVKRNVLFGLQFFIYGLLGFALPHVTHESFRRRKRCHLLCIGSFQIAYHNHMCLVADSVKNHTHERYIYLEVWLSNHSKSKVTQKTIRTRNTNN